jgi:hypothetical protein
MGIAAPIKVIIFHIDYMDDGFPGEDTGGNASRLRWSGIVISELGEGGWNSLNRDSTQLLAVSDEKFAELRPAKPHGFFKHGVEHGLEVSG